jgi:hypothetical protein
MADVEFIIPGVGIVNDTEEGFEPIIPGVGIYVEYAAGGGTEVTKTGALTASGAPTRHFAGARAVAGEI